MKIITYSEYKLDESFLSSISNFLKAQYQKIFPDATQSLNNLFNNFTKKVDTEKNVSNLYQNFIKANQTTVVNEINNAESIDAVNKIITEEIKYFYFSLKPIVNKLQNDEFTIAKIFERSRDKRLQALMSYPEDQFSNAVAQYATTIAIPTIKTDSKITDNSNNSTGTEGTNSTGTEGTNSTETANEKHIYKLFEATQEENLIAYKSAINWLNLSLFDSIKNKMQLLNQLGANTSNAVDMLSKQMKSTPNDNAKKMILNKILNMDKNELQNLANTLGIKPEELGKL
jgi:hypothetical protein